MFGLSKEEWRELNGIYTSTEICQQPELWIETLNIIDSNKDKINRFLDEKLKTKNIRVIFSGAGTSAYVGEILVPYLNEKKEYIYEAIPTTDIVSNPVKYLKKDIPTILVSFARSGNSPESVATYNLANQIVEDIYHIFITCNHKGELAEISKDKDNILLLLMPEKSNDKGFAMTSSFSCMTLAAMLIFDMENFESNKDEILRMEYIANDILNDKYKMLNEIKDLDFKRVVYLGSGSFYALSKESALKLLELTRGQITSLSETPLGFRHGPKSIINDETLIFVYLSNNEYSIKYDMDLINEIYHNTGNHKIVAISRNCNEDINRISDYYLCLNTGSDIKNDICVALLFVLYAQIFALFASVKTGVEPDNPNPSGMVNRVVQGVVIHNYN